MKEEIKNLKMFSGSIVCGEASTGVGFGSCIFARPPSLASRYHEIFNPRKMEFLGWITDCTKGSLQGITDDEVMTILSDLEKMIPRQAHQWIDWDQTREQQGNWPTKKMVSVWFKNETILALMIELLKVVKEEMKKVSCKMN